MLEPPKPSSGVVFYAGDDGGSFAATALELARARTVALAV